MWLSNIQQLWFCNLCVNNWVLTTNTHIFNCFPALTIVQQGSYWCRQGSNTITSVITSNMYKQLIIIWVMGVLPLAPVIITIAIFHLPKFSFILIQLASESEDRIVSRSLTDIFITLPLWQSQTAPFEQLRNSNIAHATIAWLCIEDLLPKMKSTFWQCNQTNQYTTWSLFNAVSSVCPSIKPRGSTSPFPKDDCMLQPK